MIVPYFILSFFCLFFSVNLVSGQNELYRVAVPSLQVMPLGYDDGDPNPPSVPPYQASQFISNQRPRQQFMARSSDEIEPQDQEQHEQVNTTALTQFIRSFLDDSQGQEANGISHATARDFSGGPVAPQYQQPYPQSLYHPKPVYEAPAPAPYNPAYKPYPQPAYQPKPSYEGPAVAPYNPTYKTFSLLKPLAGDLLKPVASKVSTKIGGLLSVILALLGGFGADTSFGGLKDVLINGIIKPLFLMKGGLKALISKLAIPVIALLLINLEVLVTIWWLWEDCEKPVVYKQPAPVYQYQKPVYPYSNPGYNTY